LLQHPLFDFRADLDDQPARFPFQFGSHQGLLPWTIPFHRRDSDVVGSFMSRRPNSRPASALVGAKSTHSEATSSSRPSRSRSTVSRGCRNRWSCVTTITVLFCSV